MMIEERDLEVMMNKFTHKKVGLMCSGSSKVMLKIIEKTMN